MNILYLTMLLVIFVICATLIFHPDYDDGIVGKFGLGMMGGAAAIVLMSTAFEEATYHPLKENVLLVGGITVFMLRFIYRWSKWRCTALSNFDWNLLHRTNNRRATHE